MAGAHVARHNAGGAARGPNHRGLGKRARPTAGRCIQLAFERRKLRPALMSPVRRQLHGGLSPWKQDPTLTVAVPPANSEQFCSDLAPSTRLL
jgi:hypothetical protein